MNKKFVQYSLISAVAFAMAFVAPEKAYAACETNYGGGQTCTFNKRFDIDKDVRLEGDNEWKDKVIGVEKDDVIEFRIKIENTGEVSVDNMEMKDFLPDELVKVSGNLTEEWDDFGAGDSREFKIKAAVKSSEFDKENFEKCVVNKAVVKFDGDEEGSDTATVCYGELEITELPKTGAGNVALGIAGALIAVVGFVLKRRG